MESPFADSEEELLLAIGRYAAWSEIDARPKSLRDIGQLGRRWLREFDDAFREQFCALPLVRYARANPSDVPVVLAATAAALAHFNVIDTQQLGGDVAFMALTALVAKKGLGNYCGPLTPDIGDS